LFLFKKKPRPANADGVVFIRH